MGKAETIRDGPFYDRVMRWREDKEKTASVKKQQVDRSSMQVGDVPISSLLISPKLPVQA